MIKDIKAISTLCAMALLITACHKAAAPALPNVQIDPERITVSGISSGAYMAHQVHLVYSKTIAGAALIAGGPYACAAGRVEIALSTCMQPDAKNHAPDIERLADIAKERAASNQIDALAGLSGDRVWVMHGTQDTVVAEAVTKATLDLYRQLQATIEVTGDFTRATPHAFSTPATGDCTPNDAYLAPCGWDMAGEIFQQVVQPGLSEPGAGDGALLAFDQAMFVDPKQNPELADSGYVYVPKACLDTRCGLHIAFHGCQMHAERIGTSFVSDAGYNAWADAARVVVLYPQTQSSWKPLNPKACWDWWGYSSNTYDTREGAQMRWLARVLAHWQIKV